jgi:hypothetical protein
LLAFSSNLYERWSWPRTYYSSSLIGRPFAYRLGE